MHQEDLNKVGIVCDATGKFCYNSKSIFQNGEFTSYFKKISKKNELETKINCECSGKYTKSNASNHKKTNTHKHWEKEVLNKTPAKKTALSSLLNHAGVSDDVISCHILPWVDQFKFREHSIPRMLIDYTRIQNPKLLDEYNKLTDFEAALNIPKLIEKMQGIVNDVYY